MDKLHLTSEYVIQLISIYMLHLCNNCCNACLRLFVCACKQIVDFKKANAGAPTYKQNVFTFHNELLECLCSVCVHKLAQ